MSVFGAMLPLWKRLDDDWSIRRRVALRIISILTTALEKVRGIKGIVF